MIKQVKNNIPTQEVDKSMINTKITEKKNTTINYRQLKFLTSIFNQAKKPYSLIDL